MNTTKCLWFSRTCKWHKGSNVATKKLPAEFSNWIQLGHSVRVRTTNTATRVEKNVTNYVTFAKAHADYYSCYLGLNYTKCVINIFAADIDFLNII